MNLEEALEQLDEGVRVIDVSTLIVELADSLKRGGMAKGAIQQVITQNPKRAKQGLEFLDSIIMTMEMG